MASDLQSFEDAWKHFESQFRGKLLVQANRIGITRSSANLSLQNVLPAWFSGNGLEGKWLAGYSKEYPVKAETITLILQNELKLLYFAEQNQSVPPPADTNRKYILSALGALAGGWATSVMSLHLLLQLVALVLPAWVLYYVGKDYDKKMVAGHVQSLIDVYSISDPEEDKLPVSPPADENMKYFLPALGALACGWAASAMSLHLLLQLVASVLPAVALYRVGDKLDKVTAEKATKAAQDRQLVIDRYIAQVTTHKKKIADILRDPNFSTIDSDIAFAKTMLNKHFGVSSDRRLIEADIKVVERKRKDENLYLAVIGEFSSGKSTCINALLRDTVLESDVMQGTTKATTLFMYAPRYDVVVEYKNGGTERFSQAKNVQKGHKPLLSEIKARIKELTTDESLARQVTKITIEHPAEFLKSGLVIIDTPGLNAMERWHEDVTRTALRDIADIAIILTTADKPMPKTLNDFIKDNLSDVLENCIYVATKMDLLRERERDQQLEFIQKKVAEEFTLKEPAVLPYTPLFVLGEADQDIKQAIGYVKKDYQALVDSSYNTESVIFDRLRKQRVHIQMVKLTGIFRQIFSKLTADMTSRRNQFEEKYAVLTKHQKPDFVKFIENMKEKHLSRFNQEYEYVKIQIANKCPQLAKSQVDKLTNDFFRMPDNDSVENFCKNMPSTLKSNGEALTKLAQNELRHLSEASVRIMKEFWAEFSKIYSELDALGVEKISIAFNMAPSEMGIIQPDFSFVQEVKTEGAVAGAVLGTFIAPGLGTVIGGMLGSFVNSLFTDVNEVKHKVWNQMVPGINQTYANIEKYVYDSTHNAYVKLFEDINTQMDNCDRTYRATIGAMRRKNEEERKELDGYISMLTSDIEEIENRNLRLNIADGSCPGEAGNLRSRNRSKRLKRLSESDDMKSAASE